MKFNWDFLVFGNRLKRAGFSATFTNPSKNSWTKYLMDYEIVYHTCLFLAFYIAKTGL